MTAREAPLQLGPALLRSTSLSEDDLQEALRKQEESGTRLTQVLLELELVSEPELLKALAELYSLPLREELDPDSIDGEVATQLPISFVKQHNVLPLGRDGDRLEVAIADPLLTDPLDDLQLVYGGAEVNPVLVGRRALRDCINHVYDQASSAEDVADRLGEEELSDVASELIEEPVAFVSVAKKVRVETVEPQESVHRGRPENDADLVIHEGRERPFGREEIGAVLEEDLDDVDGILGYGLVKRRVAVLGSRVDVGLLREEKGHGVHVPGRAGAARRPARAVHLFGLARSDRHQRSAPDARGVAQPPSELGAHARRRPQRVLPRRHPGQHAGRPQVGDAAAVSVQHAAGDHHACARHI